MIYVIIAGGLLIVLLFWGVVSMGSGMAEREYDATVEVDPSDHAGYIKARMKADQLYSEWLATIPDQMSNEAFDKSKANALGCIAIITGLPLAHVKQIFK